MPDVPKQTVAFPPRVVLATVCLLAVCCTCARGAVIVSSSRTSAVVNGTTYDQITFNISAFTGTDSTYAGPFQDASANVDSMSNISGTFTITGGLASLAGASGTAGNNYRTTNPFAPGTETTPPGSYINYDSVAGGVTTTPSSPTAGATAISSTWFTSTAANRLRPVESADGTADSFNQTQLAVFFVTPGANISFSGTDGTDANSSESLSFTAVPEPASVGLLRLVSACLLLRRRLG